MPEPTPETKRLFAKRHIGRSSEEDFVVRAVNLLEAGYETKSLGMLASLTKPYYYSEVEDYFRRSLKELSWAVPEREESLRWYTRDIAAKVLRNQLYDRIDISSNRELSDVEFETEISSEARSLLKATPT